MKGKQVNIIDLSRFLLYYFIKDGIPISHLKLQKVLYYTQAWHLVYFDRNPFFDEQPEAWVNGPVYRTVYNEFKPIGIYNNITVEKLTPNDLDEELEKYKLKLNLDNEQFEFINSIIKHYGLMTHEKLIYITHTESPWNMARKGLGVFDYSDNKITHDSMYEYYKNLLENGKH